MSAAPKLFRKQSGQFKATVAESQEMLAATKQLVEHVQSDPPPPLPSSRNRFDSSDKSNRYVLINTPEGLKETPADNDEEEPETEQ